MDGRACCSTPACERKGAITLEDHKIPTSVASGPLPIHTLFIFYCVPLLIRRPYEQVRLDALKKLVRLGML